VSLLRDYGCDDDRCRFDRDTSRWVHTEGCDLARPHPPTYKEMIDKIKSAPPGSFLSTVLGAQALKDLEALQEDRYQGEGGE
jgi:hypothetical protein